MKYKLFKISIFLLILLSIIGVLCFPFDNRNLMLKVETNQGEYLFPVQNDEIANNNIGGWRFDAKDIVIKKVLVYGAMKSMVLEDVIGGGMLRYVDQVKGGTYEWQDDCLVIHATEESSEVFFNDDFITFLENISASFVQERIIMCGFLAAFYMIILIAIRQVRGKRQNSISNYGPLREIRLFFESVINYWNYMTYAASTDLKAEVANSYLNRLWWLLEPFLNMIVYVVVFGNVLGNNIMNYATFVFSALLMWNFFQKNLLYSVKLVRNNKDILTKIYVPKFVILISYMILNTYKLAFSAIVLVGMMLIFHIQISFSLLWMIPTYIVLFLLTFGLGMILLHFGVYVDDLAYAVGILINMFMFLSGIFYDVMGTLPYPLNAIMICLNPVAMLVDTMRDALLYSTVSNVPLVIMWLVLSCILCYLGIDIVYKSENSYVKVV